MKPLTETQHNYLADLERFVGNIYHAAAQANSEKASENLERVVSLYAKQRGLPPLLDTPGSKPAPLGKPASHPAGAVPVYTARNPARDHSLEQMRQRGLSGTGR